MHWASLYNSALTSGILKSISQCYQFLQYWPRFSDFPFATHQDKVTCRIFFNYNPLHTPLLILLYYYLLLHFKWVIIIFWFWNTWREQSTVNLKNQQNELLEVCVHQINTSQEMGHSWSRSSLKYCEECSNFS